MRMEEEAQRLRSRATELLLLEDWEEYVRLYTRFISLCSAGDGAGDPDHLRKLLCGALSNRAEARLRLRDLLSAADDCDRALDLDPSHPKTLVCKGKILLEGNCYAAAGDCFRRALLGSPGDGEVRRLADRCRKLEAQSKTGVFDLSEWILGGFTGDPPELAEHVGAVEIRRSEISGRGLFATRDIEAGTTLAVTKAVAVGRGILPESGDGAPRLVLWKDFVGRLLDAAGKCGRTLRLIYLLSAGEAEDSLPVPDIGLFSPGQIQRRPEETLDVDRILKILDVNCLTEDSAAAVVLGRKKGWRGVGLWLLGSLVNHSCSPNARRVHAVDHVLIQAARDVKAGEEITWPYVDVLAPLGKRREALERAWGFRCECPRCRFEAAAQYAGELEEVGVAAAAARLEEAMAKKRWAPRRSERGFLRASFWGAYEAAYSARKRERWVPAEAAAAESVAAAVGGDERLLKVMAAGTRRKKGGERNPAAEEEEEDERVMKMARAVYGKVAKKQAAMRALVTAAAIVS